MRIEGWGHSRAAAKVWLVEFPDDPKLRPALIVSPDVRNEFANSVFGGEGRRPQRGAGPEVANERRGGVAGGSDIVRLAGRGSCSPTRSARRGR
ncbi:MAG TPA: hypothetical protein VGR35_00880 [Tepidisphaeraceae bacterium]|nr:hypothetical protein [Tepidisphaeraceae bacterium]